MQKIVAARMRKGFTLIELMLAMGIIAVLSGIVIATLAPTRQLASTRDAKRMSDVNTILNAIYQYVIDTNNLPASIPNGTALGICRTGSVSCVNGVNLNALSGAYLVSIPIDPRSPETGTGTDYFIRRDANGRITVTAPLTEEQDPITVTR